MKYDMLDEKGTIHSKGTKRAAASVGRAALVGLIRPVERAAHPEALVRN